MKSRLVSSRHSGFSLVELLVVIMIIAILMGLTVVGTQYAMSKGSENKTRMQMKTLEGGLEKYYNDQLAYPNPSSSGSKVLYIALTGDGISFDSAGKPRFTGMPNGSIDDTERRWPVYLEELLSPGGSKTLQGWVNTKNYGDPIIDAFGEPFQYVCRGNPPVGIKNTSYDLWSYATDSTKNAQQEAKWVKNW